MNKRTASASEIVSSPSTSICCDSCFSQDFNSFKMLLSRSLLLFMTTVVLFLLVNELLERSDITFLVEKFSLLGYWMLYKFLTAGIDPICLWATWWFWYCCHCGKICYTESPGHQWQWSGSRFCTFTRLGFLYVTRKQYMWSFDKCSLFCSLGWNNRPSLAMP